jgi:AcrR family transcriptional regulator
MAAASVFQQRGFHGATMAEIAERLDLTAGSLYHHYQGKDALLVAVLNEGLDVVLARLDTIMQQPISPPLMLRQMVEAQIVSVTQNVAAGAAIVFESRTLLEIPAARESYMRRRDAFERCYRQVIERGIACGDFRAVDVAIFTKALLGAHNWISVWYHPGGRLNGEQIAAQMVDIWLRALHPD